MNAILVTSNNSKLKEFKRFGLDLSCEKGKDISEVDGTLINGQWKVEFGIGSFTEDEHKYYFTAASGTVYECVKDRYNIINQHCINTLNNMLLDFGDKAKIVDEIGNWNIKKLDYGRTINKFSNS